MSHLVLIAAIVGERDLPPSSWSISQLHIAGPSRQMQHAPPNSLTIYQSHKIKIPQHTNLHHYWFENLIYHKL